MKKSIITLIILAVVVAGAYYFFGSQKTVSEVASFKECADAGNPVMESYPRQCRSGNQTFVEYIGNELEKQDLIRINNPRPNDKVLTSTVVTGEARGTWYFEGDFPVELVDGKGNTVTTVVASAQGEWMTEDFVPFEATLNIDSVPETATGTLILHKDNPSDLPENDNQLIIPVKFE